LAALCSGYLTGLLATSTALAYDDYDKECHRPYSGGSSWLYVSYANDPFYPPGTIYQPVYDASRADWHNSPTPLLFTYSSQTQWLFGAKFFGANGKAGLTNYTCNGAAGAMDTAHAWANRTYSDGYSVFTQQAIITHELGHYVGLGHSNYRAIMGVNDGSFNGTLSDDWCGINHIYPNTVWPPQCGY
jgi:hypothetical protein